MIEGTPRSSRDIQVKRDELFALLESLIPNEEKRTEVHQKINELLELSAALRKIMKE